MTDAVLQLVLDRLDRMDADREAARLEAKQERAEMVKSIDRLADKVGVQNGRIGALELWKHGLESVRKVVSTRRARVAAFLIAAGSGVVVATAGALIAYLIRTSGS